MQGEIPPRLQLLDAVETYLELGHTMITVIYWLQKRYNGGRGGESEYSRLLKTRSLLKTRDAQNAVA